MTGYHIARTCKSSSGFSLVEVLVAAALASAVSLGLASLFRDSFENSAKIEAQQIRRDLADELRVIARTESFCGMTEPQLNGLDKDGTVIGDTQPYVLANVGKNILKIVPGNLYQTLKISRILIEPYSIGMGANPPFQALVDDPASQTDTIKAQLTVELNRGAVSTQTYRSTIPVYLTYDKTQKIYTNCTSLDDTSADKICSDLGGVWTELPTKPKCVFCGSMGFGTNDDGTCFVLEKPTPEQNQSLCDKVDACNVGPGYQL